MYKHDVTLLLICQKTMTLSVVLFGTLLWFQDRRSSGGWREFFRGRSAGKWRASDHI